MSLYGYIMDDLTIHESRPQTEEARARMIRTVRSLDVCCGRERATVTHQHSSGATSWQTVCRCCGKPGMSGFSTPMLTEGPSGE